MREPKITAEEFARLAAQGVPYVGQLGCRVERFELFDNESAEVREDFG